MSGLGEGAFLRLMAASRELGTKLKTEGDAELTSLLLLVLPQRPFTQKCPEILILDFPEILGFESVFSKV